MIRQVPRHCDPLSSPLAGPAVGERGLMRAVLEDAIHCLAAGTGPAGERVRLAADARAWVADGDLQWPFSFTNLCDVLGFSVDALRARLLARRPIRLPLDADGVAIEVTERPRRGPVERDVNDMIQSGRPLHEVAARFGISVSKVSIMSDGLASRIKAARNEEIRRLRREGWTHGALAGQFGLSRARVVGICGRGNATEATARRQTGETAAGY